MSHLSAGLLGQHPQPVGDHGEDRGKVGQAEHDPRQDQ